MVLSPPGTVTSGSMEGSMEGLSQADVSLGSPVHGPTGEKAPPPIDLDGMPRKGPEHPRL